MKRPLGVTILAVVAIIGGALITLVALFGLLGAGLLASGAGNSSGVSGANAGVVAALAVFTLILGILFIVFGIGALRLKPWAWILGVGLSILEIVNVAIGAATNGKIQAGDIVTVIVVALILIYLFSRRVRQAFGRA